MTYKKFGDHYLDMDEIESVSFYSERKQDASFYFTNAYVEIRFHSGAKLVFHDPESDYIQFKHYWETGVMKW